MAEQVTLQVAIDLTQVQAAEARVAALEARAGRIGTGMLPGAGADATARALGTAGMMDPFATAQIASLRADMQETARSSVYTTLPSNYDLGDAGKVQRVWDERRRFMSSRAAAYLTVQDAKLRGAYTTGDTAFLADAARHGYWKDLRLDVFGSAPDSLAVATSSPKTIAGLANVGWFPGVNGATILGSAAAPMTEALELGMRQRAAKPRINSTFKGTVALENAAFKKSQIAAAAESAASKPFFLKKAGPIIGAANGGLTIAAIATAAAKMNRAMHEIEDADKAAGIKRSTAEVWTQSRLESVTKLGEEILATSGGFIADVIGAVTFGSVDGRKVEKGIRDFYNYGRKRSTFNQSRDEFEHEQMLMTARKEFHKASDKWNDAFSEALLAASNQGAKSAVLGAKRLKQAGFSGPESEIEAALRDRMVDVLTKRVTEEFAAVRPGRPMTRLPQAR